MSDSQPHYERRAFLVILAVASGGYAWWAKWPPGTGSPRLRVWIAQFDASGAPTGVTEVDVIHKTDSQWIKQLPADSYAITRRSDTEFAGTGAYDKFYEEGIYRCICCGTALFDSKTKYASGTGWPSFTEPIAKENVIESLSAYFGIRQTEVKCARCEAHLGHVFDDGPPPANLRYCINSVALRFEQRHSS